LLGGSAGAGAGGFEDGGGGAAAGGFVVGGACETAGPVVGGAVGFDVGPDPRPDGPGGLPGTGAATGAGAELVGGWPLLLGLLLATGGVDPAMRSAIVIRLACPATTLTRCVAETWPRDVALTTYLPGGTFAL
jgi:hypothetical protein